MNIIELLLRISPDGGNGSTELIIGAVTILTVAGLIPLCRAYVKRFP
jgi:hypothetical protein